MPKTISKKEVEKLIVDTVIKTVELLNKTGKIKDTEMSPYQMTEKVLRTYKTFKEVIADSEEMIEQIKGYGVSKKSGSVIPMPEDTGLKYIFSDMEKADNAIKALEERIIMTKNAIKIIDKALDKIKDNQYYKTIEMFYMDNMNCVEIADAWGATVNESTIRRNKNILIEKLSVYLFSDYIVKELLL